MIDFRSSDELEISIGDELGVVTTICSGDIVVIERSGPSSFNIRALDDKEAKEYQGRKYGVDKGREQGTIKLRTIKY